MEQFLYWIIFFVFVFPPKKNNFERLKTYLLQASKGKDNLSLTYLVTLEKTLGSTMQAVGIGLKKKQKRKKSL